MSGRRSRHVVDDTTGQRVNPTPHHGRESCSGAHCWSHQVDEPSRPCFVACFECGHVYPTPRSLWWAYLRMVWAGRRWSSRRELAGLLWHGVWQEPDRIPFCQACSHDF